MRVLGVSMAAWAAPVLVGCSANLTWTEPKTYTPTPTATIFVAGLGIDDSVTILPPTTLPIAVSHPVSNSGNAAVAGPYTALDSVVRWIFQGGPTVGYGWVPGPAATHTAAVTSAAGPPLAPGATATLSFPPFTNPGCGLYRETLRLDDGGTVAERSETDNVDSTDHFFFIPSTQQFNISVAGGTPIGHNAPVATHQFTVTPAGATSWVYAGFSFTATEGSRAFTVPAPGAVGGPGPQVITMTVNPQRHQFPGGGTVTGKITVVSADGCVLKQETASVFVEH